MKAFVLLVACSFLSIQAVYYMDCCCGDFCTHKNACTGCEEDQAKPCEVHPTDQPDGDCCPVKSEPVQQQHAPHKKACAHMSPSTEITAHSTDVAPPELTPLEFVFDALVIQSPAEEFTEARLDEAVPRPTGDLPLHLAFSVLQV